MKKGIKQLLVFFHEAEKLKSILRHSWLSSGRRESTAEHTWRMALMAMLLHPRLKNKPDLLKTLKMVLVHDLVEVYATDVPAWKKWKSKVLQQQVKKREQQAINKLSKILGGQEGKEIKSLWQEYEAKKSKEAKFATALDRLEVKLQHQEADFKYLNRQELRFNLINRDREFNFDPFLMSLWKHLLGNWTKIYKKNKVDRKLYA